MDEDLVVSTVDDDAANVALEVVEVPPSLEEVTVAVEMVDVFVAFSSSEGIVVDEENLDVSADCAASSVIVETVV